MARSHKLFGEAVARCDRVTPVPTERTTANSDAGWRLAPFVLVALHHLENFDYGIALVTLGDDFVDRQIIFDK